MEIWQAVILGMVEGITEFLPISSTAHLILTTHIMGITQTNFLKSFEIIIQLGAIFAVMQLYWRSVFVNFKVIKRIIVGFIPTGILGFIFYKTIKTTLFSNDHVILSSLLLGGVILIVFEIFHRERSDVIRELSQISYSKSCLIGIAQSISMIPGISRSAATIVGGLLLGLKRKTALEFSFLLAVPTMLAASGLDLVKNFNDFSQDQFNFLIVGFLTSFGVAWVSIKFLLWFINNHTFLSFGIYRVVAALLFWWLI